MTYDSTKQHYVFFSRSNAARDAHRRGITAFETMPIPHDAGGWTYEERANGPGIEYAHLFAEGKDYVAWCEITADLIPVLIVTCFKDEIPDEIPELLELRPITPELWNLSGLPRGAARPVLSDRARGEVQEAKERAKSSAVSPVKLVHEICAELGYLDRKAIIQECIARGVNASTAATQFAVAKKKFLEGG